MSSELPWYPMYVNDWLTSRKVRRLTWAQQGIYKRLLDEEWVGGPLDGDARRIADDINAPVEDVEAVLSACFFQAINGWMNERLEEIRAEQLSKSEALAKAGRKGGKAKQRKRIEQASQATARLQPGSSIRAEQIRAEQITATDAIASEGEPSVEKRPPREPTFGDVMAVVRAELSPKDREETERSGSVLRRDFAGRVPAQDVIDACRGARKLIDAGKVGGLEPGQTVGLRALKVWKASDGRPLWDAALDEERLGASTARAPHPTARLKQAAPSKLADILRQAVQPPEAA